MQDSVVDFRKSTNDRACFPFPGPGRTPDNADSSQEFSAHSHQGLFTLMASTDEQYLHFFKGWKPRVLSAGLNYQDTGNEWHRAIGLISGL